MVTTRPATWLDAMKVTEMWGRMHLEIDPRPSMRKENADLKNFYYKLMVRLESPDWQVLLAEEDGVIIGFIMNFVHWPVYNACHVIGTCEALYVDRLHRGSGIYKTLVNESVVWGKSKNVQEFEFVSTYDEKMIRFYDQMGYEPVQILYRQKEA